MARPRKAQQAGFTLVEAMVATLVFTVGALGLLTMIYSSHQGVSAAEKITQATALARSKLDELERLPYDHALLNVGSHAESTHNLDETGAPVATSTNGDDDGLYERTWDVLIPTGGVEFKTVAVRVRWWDKNYRTAREVTLRGGKSQ